MKISAMVPCYNNATTIAETIASLSRSTITFDETLIVDDGSTDGSAEAAEQAGARVIRLGSNRGRGAARARCIEAAGNDLIVSVDGTAVLAPDFAERILSHFDDPGVAAVYGRIMQGPSRSAPDRWRGRHLYKAEESHQAGEVGSLITWGVALRRSAVLAVGNFNATLRHSEDLELGQRLIAGGWKILYEPSAVVTTLVSNSWRQVFERYWRWYAGIEPRFRFRDYLRQSWYAAKVLSGRDLRSGDLPCAAMSLLLPHYCAYRTLRAK